MPFYTFYDSEGTIQHTEAMTKDELKKRLVMNPAFTNYMESEPYKRSTYLKVDLSGDTPRIVDTAPQVTDEDKMCELKILRNNMLRRTDWTVLPDSPFTEEQRTQWKEYRQALRDIPEHYSNCDEVIWPDMPN
jgi:hypothetical protein